MTRTGWVACQLRRIFHVMNGGTPAADPDYWDGPVAWATPVDLAPVHGGHISTTARSLTTVGATVGSAIAPAPSLLVSTRAPIGYVAQADRAFAFNQGCKALVPRGTLDLRYFRYQLVSLLPVLQAAGQGSTFQELSTDALSRTRVVAPSEPEQRAIADYLDAETSRIDALIAKKQRMIELLDERTRSRFLQLVLSEGRSGRPSSTGYYLSVPDEWGETALRHLGCAVQTGPFGSQLHAEEYVEGGWPVVNPMNIVEASIEAVPTMTVTDAKRNELSRHMLKPGDIVFGRRGEMGRAGLVEDRHDGWLCGTGSLRLRIVGERLSPNYLKLLLGTAPARAYFELASVGSTMDNLNSEIVLAFPCLVPPLPVQHHIVRAVAELEAAGGKLRGGVVKQIELLREHRQALITAAVTGELEIPGVAA